MASSSLSPQPLVADSQGSILECDDLLMVCQRGADLTLPRPDELSPLPDGAKIYFLPERQALALDAANGELVELEERAVAAVVPEAYVITGHAAYESDATTAPQLPPLAYAAAGFANGRFYICAKSIDVATTPFVLSKKIRKQIVSQSTLARAQHANNALLQKILHGVGVEEDPFVQAFILGQDLLPLPLAAVSTEQDRHDLVTLMRAHAQALAGGKAIFRVHLASALDCVFQLEQLAGILTLFRQAGQPEPVQLCLSGLPPAAFSAFELCLGSGVSSLRVALHSAREESYVRYHAPHEYAFSDVLRLISLSKSKGVKVSLALLYFTGFSDSEDEFAALLELCLREEIDFLRLENLCMEPQGHAALMQGIITGPVFGFANFRKRLRTACGEFMQVGYYDSGLV